jgi:glycosyltransferase involved in cell wall biosynthesis
VPRLSLIIITKNEEAQIARCLQSVDFADEIVVIDYQSSDNTAAIARSLGAKVIVTNQWPGFGPQKNRAMAESTGDWILSLDADEWLEKPLAEKIKAVIADPQAADGYMFRRRSRFCGKVVLFSGWWPDYVLRLWRRGKGRFTNAPVHERVIVKGRVERIREAIQHDAISSLEDAREKSGRYAAAAAGEILRRKRRASYPKAYIRGLAAFLRTYVLRLGFLDGIVGWQVSNYNARYTYQKWFIAADRKAGMISSAISVAKHDPVLAPASVAQRRRLYDCFPFYNELDLLELRLNELSNVVDRFVLSEANITYSGKRKPLIFSENKHRFAKFADRIVHLIVEEPLDAPLSPWQRRASQCNALIRGLSDAQPNDLVLFSDLDEIPRPEVLAAAFENPPGQHEVFCFELRMYNYFLNLESEERWLRSGPRMVQRQYLGERMEPLRMVKGKAHGYLRDLARGYQAWRRMGYPVYRTTIPDSGWHFTYTGGIEAIQQKVDSYAGHDKVSEEIRDPVRLIDRIKSGYSVDTRHNTRIMFRPIDDSFPLYLREHRNRFANMILESPEDLHKKLSTLR